MTYDLPNIAPEDMAAIADSFKTQIGDNPPLILVLYGSLRERSYSRLLAEEVMRLLVAFSADARTYNPSGLPLPDYADAEHPMVQKLRDLAIWVEGMVWVSPERHGAMTGIFKTQIDWIPLALGGIRLTQGKTLALMQVNGGSQSFYYGQSDAYSGALDAYADHPQSIISAKGI